MRLEVVSITIKIYPAKDHLHFFTAKISPTFATVTRESVLKTLSQSFDISMPIIDLVLLMICNEIYMLLSRENI